MSTSLCFAGESCMGCSFCENQHEDDLAKAQREKKRTNELRSLGLPTLEVKLGDFLKKPSPKKT